MDFKGLYKYVIKASSQGFVCDVNIPGYVCMWWEYLKLLVCVCVCAVNVQGGMCVMRMLKAVCVMWIFKAMWHDVQGCVYGGCCVWLWAIGEKWEWGKRNCIKIFSTDMVENVAMCLYWGQICKKNLPLSCVHTKWLKDAVQRLYDYEKHNF